MPSRKKLKGQARKAKRATATTQDTCCGACDHLDEIFRGKWSHPDANAANKLADEYGYGLSALNIEDPSYHDNVSLLVRGTYDKYRQFNDR
eukprot:scaffold49682_cov53-Cyclotella_meneghiniana.AAC.5